MSATRVLIAEDHYVIAQLLTDLLQDAGYEVASAMSVDDARRMVDLFEPRVVLIGYNGRGDFAPGWEAAAAVARMGGRLSLVMLSTSENVLAEIGRTRRGRLFSKGLLKPFHLDDLVNCVRCAVDCEPPTPWPETAGSAKHAQDSGRGQEKSRSSQTGGQVTYLLRDHRQADGESIGCQAGCTAEGHTTHAGWPAYQCHPLSSPVSRYRCWVCDAFRRPLPW